MSGRAAGWGSASCFAVFLGSTVAVRLLIFDVWVFVFLPLAFVSGTAAVFLFLFWVRDFLESRDL